MFVGSYTPKLDEKNRLFLPAKFREQLAEGLVVTKGQDFCLNVFPRRRLRGHDRPHPGGTAHRPPGA